MSINLGGNIISSDDFNSSGNSIGSPYLPDDGLMLNMSANSYHSGQTTWVDQQNGIVFNSVNGTTAKTTVEGIPCISFDSTNYWETNQADADKVDMRGAFTLVLIFHFPANSDRNTIFEKRGPTYRSYEHEIACTWEVGDTLSHYRGYNAYDSSSTKVYTRNRWTFIAKKGNYNTSTGHYYDGNWVANYNNRNDNNILRSGNIVIGSGYAGTMLVGHLHACLVWTIDLTDSQIDQVYNYYSNIFTLAGTTLYY